MRRHCLHGLGLFFVTFFGPASARAQCLQWQPGFEPAGVGGVVRALVEFDGGSGSQLFVAGSFTTAGTTSANDVASWNGTAWSPLSIGMAGPSLASALATFDDGNGTALYLGGIFGGTVGGIPFNGIAKWDGASWSTVGNLSNCLVNALAVFDEGNGPVLFAAGSFAFGGPQRILRWDGDDWSTVGGGLTGDNASVNALTVFDDGTGAALYAAGWFTLADGAPANRIAKWDGVAWSPLGSGLDNEVLALTSIDAGQPGGPALIAGGRFSNAGGVAASCVAKWDGASWSALGSGIAPTVPGCCSSSVRALAHYDSGAGPELYVGGDFVQAGATPVTNFAKWDGANWSSLGNVNDTVWALRVFDDGQGSGPSLFVGGDFNIAGATVAHGIARRNGGAWSALGATKGITGVVHATQVFDDGGGAALFVAGAIAAAGNVLVHSIAKWDGASWSDVGGGVSGHPLFPSVTQGAIYALTVFDDGSGDALYAGGLFAFAGGASARCIARWDGTNWTPVGNPLGNFVHEVRALAVFDDGTGPALYAGGNMSPQGYISRFNGTTWQTVGGGMNNQVFALEVFDDGAGPALFAGGAFSLAGGGSAVGIARWKGAWSALGTGTAGQVHALEVYSGGTGVPALYAGGTFDHAGSMTVNQIARWSGGAWSTVGSGLGGDVTALHVSDEGNGNGQVLYAGGGFDVQGGAPADRLAKWNGASWTAAGSGSDVLGGGVNALASFDGDGDGRADLFVAGSFRSTSGVNAENFAELRQCAGPGTAFCFGDGTAGDCPCAAPNVVPIPSGSNFGGCANSFNPHGGGMSATGNIQPSDTVTLIASGISPVGFCQFFKTDSTSTPGIAVLDGISCASGNLIRFGNQNASGGVAKYPNVPLGLVTPVSVRGATPVGSGLTGHYQVVYRNTKIGFCTPDTLNFSSSYRITWN